MPAPTPGQPHTARIPRFGECFESARRSRRNFGFQKVGATQDRNPKFPYAIALPSTPWIGSHRQLWDQVPKNSGVPIEFTLSARITQLRHRDRMRYFRQRVAALARDCLVWMQLSGSRNQGNSLNRVIDPASRLGQRLRFAKQIARHIGNRPLKNHVRVGTKRHRPLKCEADRTSLSYKLGSDHDAGMRCSRGRYVPDHG